MTSVAVVNQKGGVGKTTVTLGLAEAAAALGLRVLVVDLDPQANASTGLAVWGADRTIDDVLSEARAGAALEAVTSSNWPDEGLRPDLIPGSHLLAAREPQMISDPLGAQDRLKLALSGARYDLTLIDCPPSLGLLCVNGLFAADKALIVTEPAAWAADGVDLMANTIQRVASRIGSPVLAGVVVNRLGRTRDNNYWKSELAERFSDSWLPPISLRAAIAEASGQSLPLRELGNRPGAREAILQFDELLDALGLAETHGPRAVELGEI
tara:strand:- start:612 stop:1415 length:804 start_codon:yes stop_codon:yes gene_type:complete